MNYGFLGYSLYPFCWTRLGWIDWSTWSGHIMALFVDWDLPELQAPCQILESLESMKMRAQDISGFLNNQHQSTVKSTQFPQILGSLGSQDRRFETKWPPWPGRSTMGRQEQAAFLHYLQPQNNIFFLPKTSINWDVRFEPKQLYIWIHGGSWRIDAPLRVDN